MQQLIASSLLHYFYLNVPFHYVDFEYMPRESNWEADELAQVALV